MLLIYMNTKEKNILSSRLCVLFFLQFAAWGAYLTSMGAYLAKIGLTSQIGYFYSVQGIVAIFMPTLMGIVADRWIQAQKLLAACHFSCAGLMAVVALRGLSSDPSFLSLFVPYTMAVAFYMPTLSLSNSVAYSAMSGADIDKVATFPRIRIFGTLGFIASMWIVDLIGAQESPQQFIIAAVWGVIMGVYSLTMPQCPVAEHNETKSIAEQLGLNAFKLFLNKRMCIFFIFSALLGMSLQVTNSFANPYIRSFAKVPEFARSPFVEHSNMLISLSQLSELLCILLIPFFMKRFGIKTVMLISMLAWVLRFGLFGIGYPAWPGITALVLSMIVYGVAFDFFNISGSLYVDNNVGTSLRSSAQGLFVLMTNGIGSSIGMLLAQMVINETVVPAISATTRIEGWQTAWLIFAAYSAIVALLFALLFKSGGNEKEEREEVLDSVE